MSVLNGEFEEPKELLKEEEDQLEEDGMPNWELIWNEIEDISWDNGRGK
jgi:hypothetical protein